jgi:hypothetical protein
MLTGVIKEGTISYPGHNSKLMDVHTVGQFLNERGREKCILSMLIV